MQTETLILATFGQKFLSRLIDFIIVTLLASLMILLWSVLLEEFNFFRGFIYIISRSLYPNEYREFMALMIWGYVFIGFFLYYPILESTGGTWGKRIVGVKTVGLNESKTPNLPKQFSWL